MNILSVITIDLETGAKRQHEVDYDLKDSRIWLSRHSMWAICNNQAVMTLPKTGAAKIFLGHASDPDVTSVDNL